VSGGEARKRILFVALKRDAEPVLGRLRSAGHQVSLVEDLDEAQSLLDSGGFDQTVIAASTVEALLAQRSSWQGAGAESWRKSAVAAAHDVRALLAALGVSIDELEHGERGASGANADYEEARQAVRVLSRFLTELIEDLGSDAGRTLALAPVDLEDAVEAAAIVVYPSATERRQRLTVDIDDSIVRIEADSARLKRALVNLLAHACHQSPDMGSVSVRARPEGDACVISISYHDDAITLSGLRRLFKPVEGDARGTGLSSVQKLVEEQGGRLWMESQKWSGTTIFLSLPLSPTMAAEAVRSYSRT